MPLGAEFRGASDLPDFSSWDSDASPAPIVLPGWAPVPSSSRSRCHIFGKKQTGRHHDWRQTARLEARGTQSLPLSSESQALFTPPPPAWLHEPHAATPRPHTRGRSEIPRLQALSVAQHGFATGGSGGQAPRTEITSRAQKSQASICSQETGKSPCKFQPALPLSGGKWKCPLGAGR